MHHSESTGESDDDDAPIRIRVQKKTRAPTKPSTIHDSDDEPVFPKKKQSGDIASSGATKFRTAAVTTFLFPAMLLRVGPIDVCIVGKNGFRWKMINFIAGRYGVTLDLGASDEAMRAVLGRLNNSYMQHVRKLRINVARSVKRLLLDGRNDEADPQHAWALVWLNFLAFGINFLCFLSWQEGLGVPPGQVLMPADHPLWRALGVASGANVRLTQDAEHTSPSVASDFSNPIVQTFVEEGLREYL